MKGYKKIELKICQLIRKRKRKEETERLKSESISHDPVVTSYLCAYSPEGPYYIMNFDCVSFHQPTLVRSV